jgi:hypothetical protein
LAVARASQARRILTAFAAWLEAAPGRRVVLERTPEGWRSTLVEGSERTAKGESLTDAAAQSAVVCACEVAP